MSKIRDNILNLFKKIFIKNRNPILANVSKQNYDEYHKTYDNLFKVFSELNTLNIYLIGGISAAIQTNQDLYRQNEDLDLICKEEDLPKLINILEKNGYSVDDKRGIKTGNKTDLNKHFQAVDHELNANTQNRNMLGIGIFTFQVKNGEVITYSYSFEEKEGKFVGTEKIMPKELFELIYDNNVIDYKGLKLKTQSKEYIYMIKSKGLREKDKLDALSIMPFLDEISKIKISKIKELETKVKIYKITYNKDGKIESRIKYPSLEENINTYLNSIFMKSTTKSPEQIVSDVIKSNEYKKLIINHPEANILIENWKNKSKNYTYQDKINLLTKSYSKRIESFSKKAINNALDFLYNRYLNHGKNENDIELCNEAKEIFKLMQEYGESIKRIFVDNNINLTHITNIPPDRLEGGVLRKSIDVPNNYETEIVSGVFASSTPINENNAYIARNSSGMIGFNNSFYIYGDDNISITQDSEGKKHAILNQPNFIYYINPSTFTPVCNLTINPITNKPVFEFSEEWISDTEINITDPNQLKNIEKISDVTNLLKYYTILCDIKSQEIGIKAQELKDPKKAFKYIIEKIKDGSLRNINQETGINNKDLLGLDR